MNAYKIKFSEEWDKLKPERFEVGNFFTTFRGYSIKKHHYYLSVIGKDDVFHDVELNGKILGVAKLVAAEPRLSNDLSLDEIRKDTYGYFKRDDFNEILKKFYNMESIAGLWLVFKIIKVNGTKDNDTKERVE